MKSLLQVAAVVCLLVLLSGCNSGPTVVPVTGVATRGGQPIKNLFITFFPDDGTRASTAITDDAGRFEMQITKARKGAAVGNHKVVAGYRPRTPQDEAEYAEGKLKFHPDQDAILEKYGKRDTTALSIEVSPSGNDLELKFD